ncbi:MAG: acyl-CoA dehydrogenase family protein [Candidatus Binataceae bacterium]|nr:acyl-CoA dehydrogenase family protein [Candidatus Binataceae bacterium]
MEQLVEEIRRLAAEFALDYARHDQKFEFPGAEIQKLKSIGALKAPVPKKFGGLGMAPTELIRCIKILAEGNPSVAQIFFVHCLDLVIATEFATAEQLEWLMRAVVDNNCFVGQATAERHSKTHYAFETVFTPVNGGVKVRGRKFFTTGSGAADVFLIFGAQYDGGIGAAIAQRGDKGLELIDDWKAMGQRGTTSGTVVLNDLFIPSERVFPKFQFADQGPQSLMGPYLQLGFTAIYTGIAGGALRAGIEYVRTKTRAYPESGVSSASDDRYIQREVGMMRAQLSAADSLLDRAARRLEEAFAMRGKAGDTEMKRCRAEASVAVAEAKIIATEAALRIGQDIFQLCGARSALYEEDMDRFWRDARTLTVHDPKDYRAMLIGQYVLLDKFPAAGFRS